MFLSLRFLVFPVTVIPLLFLFMCHVRLDSGGVSSHTSIEA
jgi:hypothetical protein